MRKDRQGVTVPCSIERVDRLSMKIQNPRISKLMKLNRLSRLVMHLEIRRISLSLGRHDRLQEAQKDDFGGRAHITFPPHALNRD